MVAADEIITLDVENKQFGLFVSSKQVPGLFLWGKDPDTVFDDVIPALKGLYLHNRNWVVDVVESVSPARNVAAEPVPRKYVVKFIEERAQTA